MIAARQEVAQDAETEKLTDLDNTVQLSWLLDLSKSFFGFEDERITSKNWEKLYDTAAAKMAQKDWEDQVLKISRIERVFLTNEFDDPLSGFDTKRYIPCLRTDDLVFHFTKPGTRERLAKATGIEAGDAATLRQAIGKLFGHFVKGGAKACAISGCARWKAVSKQAICGSCGRSCATISIGFRLCG